MSAKLGFHLFLHAEIASFLSSSWMLEEIKDDRDGPKLHGKDKGRIHHLDAFGIIVTDL